MTPAHLESADLRPNPESRDRESGSESGWLPKFNGVFLVQRSGSSLVKFSWTSKQFFWEIRATLNAPSCSIEKSF